MWLWITLAEDIAYILDAFIPKAIKVIKVSIRHELQLKHICLK